MAHQLAGHGDVNSRSNGNLARRQLDVELVSPSLSPTEVGEFPSGGLREVGEIVSGCLPDVYYRGDRGW
jgi:hypothetical protein